MCVRVCVQQRWPTMQVLPVRMDDPKGESGHDGYDNIMSSGVCVCVCVCVLFKVKRRVHQTLYYLA
jgi:hypothetical protein